MNIGDHRIGICRMLIPFFSELKPDASWQSARVLDSEHQGEKGEVVQERQVRIKSGFHADNQHSGRCKSQVEDDDGGEEKEKHCEKDSAKEKLVEVIIA